MTMLAFQNLNQMMFHLSQVTSSVSAGSVRVTTNSAKARADINVICSESFFNTLKIFQKSENANAFKHLPSVKGGPGFTQWLYCSNLTFKFTAEKSVDQDRLVVTVDRKKYHKLGNVCEKLESIEEKMATRSPWKESYVSTDSFEKNKSGYPPCGYSLTLQSSPIHSNFLFYSKNMVLNNALKMTQIRHFKTDQNVKAELERNPSIITRFKNVFGWKDQGESTDAPLKNLKLNVLLADKNLSPEETERTRVAFAEGYMIASKNGSESSVSKLLLNWIKIFWSVVSLGVTGWLLFTLYQNPGNTFKLRFGHKTEIDSKEISITFDDVKGAHEAKQELKEVVEFLKNPEKFSSLGGKLPKGVLLVGPPGTGKTLLARAVAGEAKVPFFHTSGSEFDEILVGQGARRIRDLFKSAKERAPCVIFIDEIDSVGSKRTSNVLHPYANQTINQLLSEMDGFRQNEGVIVLGATNRKNQLDKAILRPGRFDLEVKVDIPDYSGRKEILVHYIGKIVGRNIDVDKLARGTTGFTGADLENLINLAALRATMDGADAVTMKHLDYARDKIIMGTEKKTRIPDEKTNLITAYHEGGHALVCYYTKDSKPLHKVTIMPRGVSLGHTSFLPEKEMHYTTKSELLAELDICLGGRAAEELIFGPDHITGGASQDLKRATKIATVMVKELGMSEKVGLRFHERQNKEIGQSLGDLVDSEIKRILQESYDRAKNILKVHSKEHKLLAEALLKYETLDAEDVKAVLNDKNVDSKAAASL